MRSATSLAVLLPLAVSAASTCSSANALLNEPFCKTVTETTTQTTSTSTLTCLNSAYTASTPIGTILKRDGQASKPTYIPSSWPTTVVSSACSCLSIPTHSTTTTVTQTLTPGTITVTSTNTLTPTATATETATDTEASSHTESATTTITTTLTAYAEATTIASNGIAYRKYTHSYDANSASSRFTSSTFKSLTPDWSGVLQLLTFSTPNWPSGSQYLTLADHSAFLASQAARDYIDNWGYLWTGDASYSTWSDSNTAYQASRTGAGYTTGTTTVTLNAGDAIPLAFLWANGGGVAESYFTVTTPSGSSTTDTTGYFVQACSSSVFS
ncbi:hypothetical protein SCAR479_13539 [Seiridium cardinale]|uniref:GLEYA adhesin domain-containing protein n=1 Tax=Seiridium cardinale TaxID=138064 RepID=A0ABR2X7J6_9PEZI